MKTVDLCTGGITQTRNKAFKEAERINGEKVKPSMESARRYEYYLSAYHKEFREDYPKVADPTRFPLTPFQQWLIIITWQHCKHFHSSIHKESTIEWITQNRKHYNRSLYEQRTILPDTATNGAVVAQR